jgi:putative membrane protein
MPRILPLIGVMALLSACSPHNTTPVADAATTAAVAHAAEAPTPMDAADFVQTAAVNDMFEIQTSKLAEERSKSPKVKAFAAMMVRDHSQSSAGLKAVIATTGQTLVLPSVISADMQIKFDNLMGVSADQFDKTYLDDQVAAHQAALTVLQFYADKGDMPALKAFAGQTSVVVQLHLGQARALADSLKTAAPA